MMKNLCARSLALVATGALSAAIAQNDECSGATTVQVGLTAFDTTGATLSPEPWNCAGGGGPDLWYEFTSSTSGDDIVFETCGSGYDTALEIYSGGCMNLALIQCNDDVCALQSSITLTGGATGATYLVRIGGFGGSTGQGTLNITEVMGPGPGAPNCVETTFMSNNGGSAGGAIYFDIDVQNPTEVVSLLTHYDAPAGSSVGMEIYTTPGTHVGSENDPMAWTLVAMDNGTATSAGSGMPTTIDLAGPLLLTPGTIGIALVAIGSGHDYTNGIGTNQTYTSPDGNITTMHGSATNTPFTGAIFQPRVWNGRLCADGEVPLGTNYCVATANSTGVPGTISAMGFLDPSQNDLTLTAEDLPPNQFGIFIASMTRAFVPMNGGVSNGNLCLGGVIGQFTLPTRVRFTGASGSFDYAVDMTMIPQGTTFVGVSSGDTWNFQAWYRDSVGLGSNFTNGLEISFL